MARPRARATAEVIEDPQAWTAEAQRRHVGLETVREAARHCHGCELWRRGTQTVFGAGSRQPRLMLVGEQPGDVEDRTGEPFVGPAGRLLDRALVDVGVSRDSIYVTNAVKHFGWEERGKWRIHKKPRPGDVRACRPWVLIEIALLQPKALVCLGATAAQSLLGPEVRVLRDRGRPLTSPLAPTVLVTVHPSSLLRAPDHAAREAGYRDFVADLRAAL
jgi:uracil-DNA glycosylase family protein